MNKDKRIHLFSRSIRKLLTSVLSGMVVLGVLLWNREKFPRGRVISVNRSRAVNGTQSHSNSAKAAISQNFVLNVEQCGSAVRVVIDSSSSALQRQLFAHSLGTNLAEEESKALLVFLLSKTKEDETQVGQALKSDVMDLLCRQESLSPALLSAFEALFKDRTYNIVIRDYTIQHLAALYERLQVHAHWSVEAQQATVRHVLLKATSESDSSIAGTALLALNRLTRRYALPKEQWWSIALDLADNSSVNPLVRISALEVCATEPSSEILSMLGRIAKHEPEISVRLAAIGCLGSAGGRYELDTLRHIKAENNPRLRPAIEFAMREIEQRL